jgi:tetrahydromethanopterin S-methyltransferase subunit B
MPSVQELYELWAGDQQLRDALERSLDPRGTHWLFEPFADLGAAAVEAAAGGLTRGIYQLLGKLCPTDYVWQRA